MTNRPWVHTVVALALMTVTCLLLLRWGSMQELGEPGVRVVPDPLLGIDYKQPETNRLFIAATHSVFLPANILDFTSEPDPIQKTVIDYLPSDTTYGQRRYTARDGLTLIKGVVLMGRDRTSIHRPQICLTMAGWKIEASELRHIRISQPKPYELPVMCLRISGFLPDGQGNVQELSGMFIYWFVTDGHITPDHGTRMWLQAKDLILRGRLQRWAYVTCYGMCLPGGEEALFERMVPFIAESVPLYQTTTGDLQPSS